MDYPYLVIKDHIKITLEKVFENLHYPKKVDLEIPPENMGDFSYPCFPLCKISKISPQDTAKKIMNEIKLDHIIKNITIKSGYLNFHINDDFLITKTIDLIFHLQNKYGYLPNKEKKVIIEHTSANPNGPLHVGRARNPIIGDTLKKIYTAAGYNSESQFYLDDLGKQVAILTWGLNHISKKEFESSINKKPDHTAVVYYQKTNEYMSENEKIQKEISEIVKQSEHGNKEIIQKVKDAYKPVLTGILESLNIINITIDSFIPESKFVEDDSVDLVIRKLKQSEHCGEEDGAFYLNLDSFGIHGRNKKFFITRSDGTSLYATRDIAYHLWKAKKADLLVNILGEDHKLEAKQVEIGLTLIGEKNIPHPVFYSFVSLPGGKMSTRRGRVVYLDDLIKECVNRAYLEVKKRRSNDLSEKQMRHIAQMIGIGALRYNIIKVQPEKDIVFKWEEALNFEGNAAPFIQYAHARAAGILNKVSDQAIDSKSFTYESLTHQSEINLCKKMSILPEIIFESAHGFKPHLIAVYLYELASLFNQFYRDCPVIAETNDNLRKQRILIVNAIKIVLENCLTILGIEAPDEM
jgi:arginyl-tRNA synthetase